MAAFSQTTFNMHFLEEMFGILIQISRKFVLPKCPIVNKSELAQVAPFTNMV